MKAHTSTLVSRMIRAGLRVHACRHRVIVAGTDYRGRIITLATNSPRLVTRGFHAEERVIHTSPRTLRRIMLLRIGARGNQLPIDPCSHCQKLANRRGITIERIAVP
jgi:hypothetical protein